jgi:hypothetical protein
MSDENDAGAAKPAKPSAPRRRWLRRILAVLTGLLVGLAITEAVFWFRDDGAFPHVNFYQQDAELGVRLRPHASMRFGFQDNPVNDIEVNSQGYRGPEWTDAESEILVVGDSQVFGLGVNDDEPMAAQLAQLTGRNVINGGVPTYGPLEYTAVVRELLEARDIRTVVYVVNMANDFFEDTRPNTERHAVWDGWAVRLETAPETITSFPGRELLFRSSHAFYALRRMLNNGNAPPDALASEGSWQDLVAAGSQQSTARESAVGDVAREQQTLRLARLQAERAARDAERAVDARLEGPLRETFDDDYNFDPQLEIARGNPGDIVEEQDSEEGRAVVATASLIRRAVRQRAALLERVLQEDASLGRVVTAQTEAEQERVRLRGTSIASSTRVPSSLEGRLEEVREVCEQNGAELLVVALPLDVLVSPDEWAKYGSAPVDMEGTRVLLQDLVASAEHLGARGLDATDALRAAEPDAFLRGDLHMTAKGQRALAVAVAEALQAPAPFRLPEPGLPDGRSPVPSHAEWVRTSEATVRGSSAARCETVRIREWLRVTCLPAGRVRPYAVESLEGPADHMSIATSDAVDFVTVLEPGLDVRADFHWSDRTQTLSVTWEGEEAQIAFGESRAAERTEREPDTNAERLCACHKTVIHEHDCRPSRTDYDIYDRCEEEPSCTHLFGELTEACLLTHGDDCEGLLRCAQGDRAAMPTCPEGHVLAGAIGHCYALCDEARPCDEGQCTPWMGASVCR